jgi:hypothetical protein
MSWRHLIKYLSIGRLLGGETEQETEIESPTSLKSANSLNSNRFKKKTPYQVSRCPEALVMPYVTDPN